VDASKINMRNGAGIVVLPQGNGMIWIATKMSAESLDYIGNAYRPGAARDLARTILGEADEAERIGGNDEPRSGPRN
jgi:hypothetical protein